MSTDVKMIELLKAQPFLAGLPADYYALIADCAELADFNEGDYVLHQSQRAQEFHLLLDGRVSLNIHLPTKGSVPVETLDAPAALGWSWLVKPYKWHFDAVAVKTTHTIKVHTPCILGKIEQDKAFGYEMYQRFITVVVDRLHGTRLQMMDVYAKPEQAPL